LTRVGYYNVLISYAKSTYIKQYFKQYVESFANDIVEQVGGGGVMTYKQGV